MLDGHVLSAKSPSVFREDSKARFKKLMRSVETPAKDSAIVNFNRSEPAAHASLWPVALGRRRYHFDVGFRLPIDQLISH